MKHTILHKKQIFLQIIKQYPKSPSFRDKYSPHRLTKYKKSPREKSMKILLQDTMYLLAFSHFLLKDILLNLILIQAITLITIYINEKIVEHTVREK